MVFISNTTGLSFAEQRIGSLAAIIIAAFYLLALYYSALPKTTKNLFASIYSDSLIKTAYQHLLLLVGFDTLIYRKYRDTPPILVGNQSAYIRLILLPASMNIIAKSYPPICDESTKDACPGRGT